MSLCLPWPQRSALALRQLRDPAEGLEALWACLGGRRLPRWCLGRRDEASRSKAVLDPGT